MHPSGMPLKYRHLCVGSIGASDGVVIVSQTVAAVNNVDTIHADLIPDLLLLLLILIPARRTTGSLLHLFCAGLLNFRPRFFLFLSWGLLNVSITGNLGGCGVDIGLSC